MTFAWVLELGPLRPHRVVSLFSGAVGVAWMACGAQVGAAVVVAVAVVVDFGGHGGAAWAAELAGSAVTFEDVASDDGPVVRQLGAPA